MSNTDLKFIINNSTDSPLNLNYKILSLYRKEYITSSGAHNGELNKVEYYVNYDGTTYSNLALTEYRVYTRDPNTLLALYRTQTVNWYLTNGSIGETKVTIKYYNPSDQIDEGITRRDNILNNAKLYLLSQIGLENGLGLIVSLLDQIYMYQQGYTPALMTAISNLTLPFITPTIKATVLEILTYTQA